MPRVFRNGHVSRVSTSIDCACAKILSLIGINNSCYWEANELIMQPCIRWIWFLMLFLHWTLLIDFIYEKNWRKKWKKWQHIVLPLLLIVNSPLPTNINIILSNLSICASCFVYKLLTCILVEIIKIKQLKDHKTSSTLNFSEKNLFLTADEPF